MVDMGNFFCKMHILVNFATEADKALKIFESPVINDGNNPHTSDSSSESGCVILIRTACKAFTKHGSDKSGVASYWNSFLNSKERVSKLVTFRGNRFNMAHFMLLSLNCSHPIPEFIFHWLNFWWVRFVTTYAAIHKTDHWKIIGIPLLEQCTDIAQLFTSNL